MLLSEDDMTRVIHALIEMSNRKAEEAAASGMYATRLEVIQLRGLADRFRQRITTLKVMAVTNPDP